VWAEEWRGAVILLAALADYDRDVLKRAAWREWVATAARDLLLAAIHECR
jgi:hypothetical protein